MPRNIHQELRFQRKLRNETLQEVAAAVGKDKRTVGRWEKDVIPKAEFIVELNKHFEMDFFPLLNTDEVMQFSGNLNEFMKDAFERLLNMEAHVQVLQSEVAKMKAGTGAKPTAVKKEIERLETKAKAAANMRFDELKKKSS